jgi:hypothetical protein
MLYRDWVKQVGRDVITDTLIPKLRDTWKKIDAKSPLTTDGQKMSLFKLLDMMQMVKEQGRLLARAAELLQKTRVAGAKDLAKEIAAHGEVDMTEDWRTWDKEV